MIPTERLIRLLDHLVADRLRRWPADERASVITDLIDDHGADLDIEDIATLYRIAAGEGYESTKAERRASVVIGDAPAELQTSADQIEPLPDDRGYQWADGVRVPAQEPPFRHGGELRRGPRHCGDGSVHGAHTWTEGVGSPADDPRLRHYCRGTFSEGPLNAMSTVVDL